jgi:hypothetical protein
MNPRGFRDHVGFIAGAFAAHALAITVASSIPPNPLNLAAEGLLAVVDDRLASYELEASEPIEVDLEVVEAWRDARPAGPGRRHDFEEGEAGTYEATRTDVYWAIRGQAENPDPHMALDRYTGRAGLLHVQVPRVPTSPYGDDHPLGLDLASARGRLVGDMIGEAAGVGALGARHSLYGGGGAGEGTIGLDGPRRAVGSPCGVPAGAVPARPVAAPAE